MMWCGLTVQPLSAHGTGAGASFASPAAPPPSTHVTIVSIWASVSDGLFENSCTCGSANQGGICRDSTFILMLRAHGRVLSYVSIENGAIWPGRWQLWQFFWRIGRTSL